MSDQQPLEERLYGAGGVGELSMYFGGFGGQGIKLASQVLAQAIATTGRSVLQFASYGSEVRGGASTATVIAGDPSGSPVGSPLRDAYDLTVAMCRPALAELCRRSSPNGVLILNRSLIHDDLTNEVPTTTTVVDLAANVLAEEAGSVKAVSMVALGAIIAVSGLVSVNQLQSALASVLPAHHQRLLEVNYAAIDLGLRSAQGACAVGARVRDDVPHS